MLWVCGGWCLVCGAGSGCVACNVACTVMRSVVRHVAAEGAGAMPPK